GRDDVESRIPRMKVYRGHIHRSALSDRAFEARLPGNPRTFTPAPIIGNAIHNGSLSSTAGAISIILCALFHSSRPVAVGLGTTGGGIQSPPTNRSDRAKPSLSSNDIAALFLGLP